MKIAVIPNLTKKDSYCVTLSIYSQLMRLGMQCFFEDVNRSHFTDCNKAEFLPQDLLYRSCDCVIAVGGDGSILHAAKNAALNKKPILGVNTGYLAFMAGLEKDELELLKLFVSGDYKLEKRILLKAELFSNEKLLSTHYCVNDAIFARGAEINLINIILECDANRVGQYRADGIIIATPTGSTAYSLSAGGAVADPSAECILMTPISSHSLTSRPLIFRSDSVLKLSVAEDDPASAYFSCDGERAIPLDKNTYVLISKAEFTVDFIRLKSYTFWDTLYAKLFRN